MRNTPFTSARNLLVLIACVSGSSLGPASEKAETLRVTHVLGFEGSRDNQNGDLSIQGDFLRFQNGQSSAEIKVSTIQDLYFGQEDKQIGGTAMAVGRAAAPFESGRVVGLFAHKKYGTVTLEYRDGDGGLHGAIFQLNRGEVETLKEELRAAGVPVGVVETQSASRINGESSNATK